MIAYMLTPDRKIDERVENPVFRYTSVPDSVQRVQATALSPDAESWRVARQVFDRGPKVARQGRIDVRECVFRIARAEAFERLPRVNAPQHVHDIRILIDYELARGLFAYDVDQLERALRSVCGASSGPSCVLMYGERSWLAGSGPIWTFTPFRVPEGRTWHIVIAGGRAATEFNLEIWGEFVRSFGPLHPVSIVWVGDVTRKTSAKHGASWFSLKAK